MTDSDLARHVNAQKEMVAAHHGHHAMGSMPVRHRLAAPTIARQRRDRIGMGTPDARTGVTMIDANRVHDMIATNVRADKVARPITRRDVTKNGDRAREVPALEIRVGTVQLDRRVEAPVRVASLVSKGVRLDRNVVRIASQLISIVGSDRPQEDDNSVTTRQQVEQEVAVTDRRMTIAIDGPAAAGKSTVGEIVAQRIDGIYFDTGVLYRALTLSALERGLAPDDENNLALLAASMDVRLERPTVNDGRSADILVDGRDVTASLRSAQVDRNVSEVSAHRAVRAALLGQQRRIASSGRVVMVGRDIGTVVLPDADLKIFLVASPEERARRRHVQLEMSGKRMPYDDVLADMLRRDRIDSERDLSPLRPADDAVIVHSDTLTIEEVSDLIVQHARALLRQEC